MSFRVVLLWMVAFAGCHSARYVEKGPDEGIVAIPVDNDGNRKKAEELMSRHFPGGYEIVFEEEVTTGSVTRHHNHSNSHQSGAKAKIQQAGHEQVLKINPQHSSTHGHASSITTDKTEWRIRYRRKRGAPRHSGPGSLNGY